MVWLDVVRGERRVVLQDLALVDDLLVFRRNTELLCDRSLELQDRPVRPRFDRVLNATSHLHRQLELCSRHDESLS